ncbi:MAG: hypothetical protein AAGF07_03050 [Patescibacteria group bacterium]
MLLKNLKINDNQLFIPSILLLGSFFTYQISILSFKNQNESYTYLLAFSLVVFAVKSFIISFAGLEKYKHLYKWALFLFNLGLFLVESWLVWIALNELTLNSYPQYTLGALLLANVGFYLQAYIARVKKMLWICISSFIIYVIIFVLLFTKAFDYFIGNSLLLIVFQQTISYIALGMELVMLFLVSRFFIGNSDY